VQTAVKAHPLPALPAASTCRAETRVTSDATAVLYLRRYQQKLQTSLMYLASVADAQPQVVTAVAPAPAAAVAQPAAQLQQQ